MCQIASLRGSINKKLPEGGLSILILIIISRAATGLRILERFPAKWMPVRVKKTRQNKEIEPPFRFNRNGKGSSSHHPVE